MPDFISADEIEIIRKNACAFTGTRDLKSGEVEAELFSALLKTLTENGKNTFLCGMARGFDLFAGKCVIELKKSGYDIKLIACVPCSEQDRYFTDEERIDYNYVLEESDERVLICSHYYNGCMLRRNRFMVDNSALLVAHIKEDDISEIQGGTGYTVAYAINCGIEILAV